MTELPFTIDTSNFNICFKTGEVYTIHSSKRVFGGDFDDCLKMLYCLLMHPLNKIIQPHDIIENMIEQKTIQFILFRGNKLQHVVSMTYDDNCLTCSCTRVEPLESFNYLYVVFERQLDLTLK